MSFTGCGLKVRDKGNASDQNKDAFHAQRHFPAKLLIQREMFCGLI